MVLTVLLREERICGVRRGMELVGARDKLREERKWNPCIT